MSCKHCVKHVTDALNEIKGTKAVVSLETNTASVDSSASPETLKAAVEDAGYDVIAVRALS